jgi:hypothetical protein
MPMPPLLVVRGGRLREQAVVVVISIGVSPLGITSSVGATTMLELATGGGRRPTQALAGAGPTCPKSSGGRTLRSDLWAGPDVAEPRSDVVGAVLAEGCGGVVALGDAVNQGVPRLGRDARRVLASGDVVLRDQLRRRARLEDLGDFRLLVNRRRERAVMWVK